MNIMQAISSMVSKGTFDDACKIFKAVAPMSGGFDTGCELLPESTRNRLVFSVDYHHTDDDYRYSSRTQHRVIVTADLARGYKIRVTGRDLNQIKGHITEVFNSVLGDDYTGAIR